MCTVIGLIIWLIVRGNKWHNEIDDIRRDYTNQEYFFALGTSTYGEAEDISMDFLDLAIEVFPELKKYELEQKKKTGEKMEVDKSVIEGKKGKSKDYIFDVFAKTNDGDFLIKHFKKDKEVKFKEIEEAVKLAKENYSPLRLVCLAKSFDSKIINEINDSESYVIPFDIIQIKEKGFAAIKLSPTTN